MARQIGDIVLVGTMDSLCFYERNGQYYVRMKPGPDRKQFFKSSKYKPQREASSRMILSARLASLIYNKIPKEKKEYKVCSVLQKRAAMLFKGNVNVAQVIEALGGYLVEEGYLAKPKVRMLSLLASDPSLSPNQRTKYVRKDVDHFSGVKIRSKDGRWFRLYHRDELKLLYTFEDRIGEGDETWLTEFLVRRKGLPTYRLRHKKKRLRKVKEVTSKVLVQNDRSIQKTSSVYEVPKVRRVFVRDKVGGQAAVPTRWRGRQKGRSKRRFTLQFLMEDG